MPLLDHRQIRIDPVLAELLPPVSKREYSALLRDVSHRGILVDLLLTRDNLLLDGHRRLSAAKEAGIRRVPVKRLDIDGQTWEAGLAIAVNLHRRHLNEAQRACLGSSLLRLEREKARKRQHLGQDKGRRNRWSKLVVDDGHPQPDRATQRVASLVGVSRQTFERVEVVKRADPDLLQRMIAGRISVSAAYSKVKVEEIRRQSRTSTRTIKSLASVAGRYRTVYMDPPWEYRIPGRRAAASLHYPTISYEKLESLPVPDLAHPEGCHFWIWTTWPKIRDGAPHQLLESWGLRWVGEVLWDKQILGTGRWFRSRTEVLILAVSGETLLMSDYVDPLISIKRSRHSEKPERFKDLVEGLSPAPRIELFARATRRGWDHWGYEATSGT